MPLCSWLLLLSVNLAALELLPGLSVILALMSAGQHVDRGVDGGEEVADKKHDDDALCVAALLDPIQFNYITKLGFCP